MVRKKAAGGSSRGTPRQPERGAPPQQGAERAGCQGRGRGGGGPPQGGRGGYGSGRSGGGRGGGPSSGDPFRPPYPELYRATPAPYPAGVTPQAMSEASSSSRTPVSYSRDLQNVPPPMGQSTAAETPVSFLQALQNVPPPMGQPTASVAQVSYVPPSSESMRVSLRSRKGGSVGKKCTVKANHFFAELPDKKLHQYHVTITPEVKSRRVNRAVMKQLVKLYQESLLGNCLPAYDGCHTLYTAGSLPFTTEDFKITLVAEEDGSGCQRRERQFCVKIKLAAIVDLQHLGLFLEGERDDAPLEALRALDIVLHEVLISRYCPVGRSFYSPNLKQTLGEGLESWQGFYQSIRPTQMGLSLNLDMSSTAFIVPLPVDGFVIQLLKGDVSAGPLSDRDLRKIEKALIGVKVEVTHCKNKRMKHRISGLTPQPTQDLTFPVDERGTLISVVEYFQDTYNYPIQRTQWPCLQVGNPQRPHYLPMEVCKIVEGQRYSKGLNERQSTALSKITCQRPEVREKGILEVVCRNEYNNDPYAEEFGIKISNELASVEARILPAPLLRYYDDTDKEKNWAPQVGQWNMLHKKVVNGGIVNNWICIDFSQNVDEIMVHTFCSKLAQMCRSKGMEFALEPLLPPLFSHPEQVGRVLKDAMTKLKPLCKKLDLLIVILPDKKGSLYGYLKRICETDLGLVSQCCLKKHVFEMSDLYLTNVCLKINVKVGGRNTVLVDALLKRIPFIGDKPTIIFGADVTHLHHEEDSCPSIAAVVASQDWPEMTKYAGVVCAQTQTQTHQQELIQDLYKEWKNPIGEIVTGGMIKELILSFYKANNGLKPERIIFYRDGVSDGQFDQVLFHELKSIHMACASLPAYNPKVTFVVVQKRHHTRLFASNHLDLKTVNGSGNILPGTVVDSKICHPTEFDFYLCSHAGIKGTSRPAHYRVLWDSNEFTADGLQLLTNNLCYTYARCTRSVSIVPPVYYAHLLAYRAGLYMEPETVGAPSVNAAVRSLPALKENMKRVMFYC